MADSKIRFDRSGGFTVLPNGVLRDSRLSLKTKGLFAILASLPPDWEYTVSGLAVVCGVGRDAVRGALKELEAARYLEREQAHGDAGRFSGNVYIIHEVSTCPDVQPLPGFPSTDNPSTENPLTEKPLTGNPPELNKDLIQERLDKKDVQPELDTPVGQGPKQSVRPKADRLPKHSPQRFTGFWAYYPRHVKRDRAVAAWDKLKPDDALIDAMGRALVMQVAYWRATETDIHFIPHAATWLNQRYWENPPEEYVLPDRSTPEGPGGWAEDREVL